MTADVVVVGSANADIVIRVRQAPAVGETVTGTRLQFFSGGKGANQAYAAAKLGAPTFFIGCVGTDPAGHQALASLREVGINCAHVMHAAEPTGMAFILVDDDGENSIAIAPGANNCLTPEHVGSALKDVVAESTVVVGSLEVPLPAIVRAAEVAAERGATFVLNPAPGRALPIELIRLCTVVVPNDIEIEQLGYTSAQALLDAGADAVVVTRGKRGAAIWTASAFWEQAVFSVSAVDTTGAGDGFTAGLATALADGLGLRDAVRLATAVGALATTAVGARAGYPCRRDAEALAAGGPALS